MAKYVVELITSFTIDIDDVETEEDAIDEAYDALPYHRITELDWDVNWVEEVDEDA